MTQETKIKALFPSREWFDALRSIINNDDNYRRIGTCDALVGIKIPDRQRFYLLTFEAFECAAVRDATETEVENADFWLEMPYYRWREMIANIQENGKADRRHTLNTLDLEDPLGLARSHDGYKRDMFYRFNHSLQYFFDASARIETTFVD